MVLHFDYDEIKVVADEHRDLTPGERLWRLEQRQIDIFVRLDKIDGRVEPLAQRQEERAWRVDAMENRLSQIERRVSEIERVPRTTSLLGDSTFVKTVIYILVAAVVGLATGLVTDFGGPGVPP